MGFNKESFPALSSPIFIVWQNRMKHTLSDEDAPELTFRWQSGASE